MLDDAHRKLKEFGTVMMPHEAMEPILADAVRASLIQWLTEIFEEEMLKSVGLKPRRRALFIGPPGVGKTTLAHHLAARVGLPMVAIQAERIIDMYVGQNARNLGALFDAARAANDQRNPIILFFDEFDSLSGKRGEARQGADRGHNEMVNTLLQRMDAYDGFVIAATNFAKAVDPAIWRRFEIQITLDMPGHSERRRILARYLHPFELPEGPLDAMTSALNEASPALIRQFCEALKRNIVLGPKLKWNMDKCQVINRILASTEPHPELKRPPLWILRGDDPAIDVMPWPLIAPDRLAPGRGGPLNQIMPAAKKMGAR